MLGAFFVIVHRCELKKRIWFARDHAENQRPSRVSGKGDGVMGFREANFHIWKDCFAYPLSLLLPHWLLSISNLLHPFLMIFLHKWPISGVLQPKFLEAWGYSHKDGVGAVRLVNIMVRHQTRSWEGQPQTRKMIPALMIQVPLGVLVRNPLKNSKEGFPPQA